MLYMAIRNLLLRKYNFYLLSRRKYFPKGRCATIKSCLKQP
jgi:hypothetical protein